MKRSGKNQWISGAGLVGEGKDKLDWLAPVKKNMENKINRTLFLEMCYLLSKVPGMNNPCD